MDEDETGKEPPLVDADGVSGSNDVELPAGTEIMRISPCRRFLSNYVLGPGRIGLRLGLISGVPLFIPLLLLL